MSSYAYVAIDPKGAECRGSLEVADQGEALRRIKEMGLFPTKLFEARHARAKIPPGSNRTRAGTRLPTRAWLTFGGWVKPRALTAFTRQLATLVEAGMPLLRGLTILREQELDHTLKGVLTDLGYAIEDGCSMAEAVAQHPKVFSRLYVNMVKAGEIGGALDLYTAS
jgi:type IV pilus assembly protein PilC